MSVGDDANNNDGVQPCKYMATFKDSLAKVREFLTSDLPDY